jgi:penicillin G amidase
VSRPARRWARVALVLAAGLALLGLTGSGFYWRWSRAALPVVDGTVALPGLQAPVTVRRDEHGIPHLRASSLPDAMRAQGYVTAQDRLWQMDVMRRAALGELADAFGEGALRADREMRTLGLNRAARDAAGLLPPDVRAALESYAAGVNAFIDAQGDALPIEFRLLRYRPRPWAVVDTLAVGKLLARDLAGGWEQEAYRALFADRLPPDVQDVLYPTRFPGDYLLFGRDARPPADSAAEETPRGSNNWVLSGAHTATGRPLLANDPHLGLGVPSIWTTVHLQAPDLDVAGVTLPGTPGVILGRNRRIAWGCTNVQDDSADLYAEEFDPTRPDHYRVGDGWEQARVIEEPILVREGTLSATRRTVIHRVTVTRHGPLIEAYGRQWALRWTGIDRAQELTAFFLLDRAQDWDSFRRALSAFPGPAQNFVYADVDGHVGWVSAGRLPIRASGSGARPYRGAQPDSDWRGFVPFEELPFVFDPPDGRIVTANNRLVGTDYPHVVTRGGIAPYRAHAILEALEAREGWTVEDFARVQAERLSVPHRDLARVLRDAAARHAGDAAWQAVASELAAWDGRLEADSRAAALAFTTFRALGERVILPRVQGTPQAERLARRIAPVHRLVTERPASWLPAGDGDWDATLLASWREAEKRLTERLGPDRSGWRYGAINRMAVGHPLSQAVPGLGRLLDPPVLEMGSGPVSPNVLGLTASGGVEGPSMRLIADMADPDNTRLTNFMGQSGHPASPHYGDQLDAWVRVEPLRLPFSEEAIARITRHTLTLTP